LVLLSQQRFAEGWADFAARAHCAKYPLRTFDRPLWDGAPLEGRTLLVHAEQGFGDTFHFARYLPLVRLRAAKVLFEIQPGLIPLFTASGFEDLVARGDRLPPFDVHVPLLNLPALFATNLENMPRDVPYLKADPARVERWRAALAPFDGKLRIGIQWQGNPAFASDHRRSIPLAQFAPLASVPGVRLFALQKFDGREQLADVAGELGIHDLGAQLDADGGSFMDTAAVMQQLDLVITSDTATAHLAGALGIRAWTLLSTAPDWRWFLDRDDSPWYPTLRLFRQTTAGDWAGVMRRVANELRQLTP
jgi:hypothetical protein